MLGVFSNHFRIGKIILSSLVLFSLGVYSYLKAPQIRPSLREFMAETENFKDKEVVLIYKKVKEEENLILEEEGKKLLLKGDIKDIKKGNTVSLIGVFKESPQGYFLEVKEYYIHHLRNLKRVVSLFALGVVVYFFFKYFSFKNTQFVENA